LIPRRNAKVIHTLPHSNQQSTTPQRSITTPVTLLQNQINVSHVDNIGLYSIEQPLASIEIESLDESLISKWITKDMLRLDLKYALGLMQQIPIKDFHIYTDGSLDTSEFNVTGHVTMGAEWILKGSELSFECSIINFPSSTRPEILVILTAILATPNNSKLTIYSDSQVAIDCIRSILSYNSKKPHVFKYNNFTLLKAIQEIIKDKELDFHLVKVKGHSNEVWNDAADLIAKRAQETSRLNIDKCIDLDSFLKYNNILFYPMWNYFIINRNIRNFNSLVYRYLLNSSWSCNSYWIHTLDRDNLQHN
jgi:ribonuclease HI